MKTRRWSSLYKKVCSVETGDDTISTLDCVRYGGIRIKLSYVHRDINMLLSYKRTVNTSCVSYCCFQPTVVSDSLLTHAPIAMSKSHLKDLTRMPTPSTSSRWQVDKEAIGLSRVQQFSHICVARPYQISVNSIFKHIHTTTINTIIWQFVPFMYHLL